MEAQALCVVTCLMSSALMSRVMILAIICEVSNHLLDCQYPTHMPNYEIRIYFEQWYLMQLISMYSSKQRTGVLDLEAGLEAYIIPPCALVDRLLKTAKKSATMASHMATSIPDTIEDSQLLLVVIHRKVSTSQIRAWAFVAFKHVPGMYRLLSIQH